MLVEGRSTIDAQMAITQLEPFAATWLQREDRTPTVRLAANPDYWDKDRGPHLREVVFRNDLPPSEALELVCTTEGEVDIVTEVSPADAARVESSEYARLVAVDAVRAVAGVINRDAEGLPLDDSRARRALNLAIDRDRLVWEAMHGHATPLAGLAPDAALEEGYRLTPYPRDAERAAELWREAGGSQERPLRISAPENLEGVARAVGEDIEGALGIGAEVTIRTAEDEPRLRRRLAEKGLGQEWDVFIHEHGAQLLNSVVPELHRAFVGATGEFRAGPVIPEFEDLFADLSSRTSPEEQGEVSHRIDRFVYDEALALFLCAPQALYAVDRHVDFTPYRTSFELAETSVNEQHWSRR